MLQRGDIVLERLTNRRAIVIHVVNQEEVTCRFGDGRFEDRFVFELELEAKSLLSFLLTLVMSAVTGGAGRERSAGPVLEPTRPRLARQSGAG